MLRGFDLRITARVGIVDLVVRAHHGTYSSLYSICERPSIHLVQSSVVNIGGHSIWQEPFPALSEVFLLIPHKVLDGGLQVYRVSMLTLEVIKSHAKSSALAFGPSNNSRGIQLKK